MYLEIWKIYLIPFWQRKRRYVIFPQRVYSHFLLHFVSWVENAKWIKIQVCDQTQIQKRPLVSCSSWSGERWERTVGVSKDLEFSRRLEFPKDLEFSRRLEFPKDLEYSRRFLKEFKNFDLIGQRSISKLSS